MGVDAVDNGLAVGAGRDQLCLPGLDRAAGDGQLARSAAIASRAASILSFAARSRFTVSRAWSRSSRTLLTVFSSASWIWLRYSVLSTRSSNPSAESTTSTRSGLPVSYIATSISRSCTSARFSRARTTSR